MSRTLGLVSLLGVIGCAETAELEPPTTEAAADIGICGANVDPLTGVTCVYDFTGARTNGLRYTGGDVYTNPEDGLDYVRCSFTTTCTADGWPRHDGLACDLVIGTGCPPRETEGTTALLRSLPPFAPEPTQAQIDQMCRLNDDETQALSSACNGMVEYVEQFEDVCCVVRKPHATTAPAP